MQTEWKLKWLHPRPRASILYISDYFIERHATSVDQALTALWALFKQMQVTCLDFFLIWPNHVKWRRRTYKDNRDWMILWARPHLRTQINMKETTTALIENYLHTSMWQDELCGLAILSADKDVAFKLDYNMQFEFAANKSKKLTPV